MVGTAPNPIWHKISKLVGMLDERMTSITEIRDAPGSFVVELKTDAALI